MIEWGGRHFLKMIFCRSKVVGPLYLHSLVPLLLFILSVLYAFCRLGVFAVCNPFRWCPKGGSMHA